MHHLAGSRAVLDQFELHNSCSGHLFPITALHHSTPSPARQHCAAAPHALHTRTARQHCTPELHASTARQHSGPATYKHATYVPWVHAITRGLHPTPYACTMRAHHHPMGARHHPGPTPHTYAPCVPWAPEPHHPHGLTDQVVQAELVDRSTGGAC